MARVKVHSEVSENPVEGEWNLCFQRVTYYSDEGGSEEGFRFIWRRPDGTLQAARGQARIESLSQMMNLIKLATEEGFFKDEKILEDN